MRVFDLAVGGARMHDLEDQVDQIKAMVRERKVKVSPNALLGRSSFLLPNHAFPSACMPNRASKR